MIRQRNIPNWELERRKGPNGLLYKGKPCKYCEEEFTPLNPSHLYCSDDCKANGTAQRHYLNTYGITLKEVNRLMEQQNFLCAICEGTGFQMNNRVYHGLNVDHDHETGVVRGLLCHNCNRALGLFKDNIRSLKRAISYLESATTIPSGSTHKCVEARNTPEE